MSFISHGLRCLGCNRTTNDAIYRKSAGPPDCAECGAEQQIDWSHGKSPLGNGDGYKSFTTIDMGVLGKCETREQYDRACAVIKERFPGHSIRVESDSQAAKSQRAEESRHRAAMQRKAHGVDKKINTEIAEMKKAKKSEARKAGSEVSKSAAALTGSQASSAT